MRCASIRRFTTGYVVFYQWLRYRLFLLGVIDGVNGDDLGDCSREVPMDQ